MELPKYVKLNGLLLMLDGDKYCRSETEFGLAWSIGYKQSESGLISQCFNDDTPHLHNKPLIEATEEEWLEYFGTNSEKTQQQKYLSNQNNEYWIKVAHALRDEFGESLVEEDSDENNPYNWWLKDVTVEDIIEFFKKI